MNPFDPKSGLLSPNIGNSALSSSKPSGLLSQMETPNASDVQANPQISLISEKGLQKSMFEAITVFCQLNRMPEPVEISC